MAVVLPQSIQSDVQQALPVIPNNGNPAGAYNMPQAGGADAQGAAQAAPDPFAWLKPSVYMEEVKTRLANWDEDVQQGIERLMLPQEQGLYNPILNAQGQGYVPVTDDGIPIMTTQYKQAVNAPIIPGEPIIPLMVYDTPYEQTVPQYVLPEM